MQGELLYVKPKSILKPIYRFSPCIVIGRNALLGINESLSEVISKTLDTKLVFCGSRSSLIQFFNLSVEIAKFNLDRSFSQHLVFQQKSCQELDSLWLLLDQYEKFRVMDLVASLTQKISAQPRMLLFCFVSRVLTRFYFH